MFQVEGCAFDCGMWYGRMGVWEYGNQSYLCSCIVKDTMGGLRETLVKELQVTPLFREPLQEVTTTTDKAGGGRMKEQRREKGQRVLPVEGTDLIAKINCLASFSPSSSPCLPETECTNNAYLVRMSPSMGCRLSLQIVYE